MQKEEEREGTWYSNIKKSIKEYKINKNIKEVIKSEWKEEVKDKIRKKAEEEVREECKRLKKTRSVKNDEYEIKVYLKKLPLEEAKDVMKMRLHMAYLTCNYASSEEVKKCPLCGEKGVITTEHYFACTTTTALVKIWESLLQTI